MCPETFSEKFAVKFEEMINFTDFYLFPGTQKEISLYFFLSDL